MRFNIEVKDDRDSDSIEPWSYFGEASNQSELAKQFTDLLTYLKDYPTVSEVRIVRQ